MLDKENKATVLALGYFDSVHLGHRKVIEKAKSYANAHNAKLIVITFGGNLRAMLSGEQDKNVYLTNEREELLKQLGVDDIFFAPVDFDFLSMEKIDFLNMLNRKYEINCYVCGEDYRFGKLARGTVDDIKRYAKEKNQDCIVTETELYNGEKISTSHIKRLLSNGNVEKANLLLASPYFVSGKVFSDRKVGRNLGFPTINLKIDKDKHHLKNAVYKGHIFIEGVKYNTIINYGSRPTFDMSNKLIEAHIVDFDGDLYGKDVKLYFDSFMREIQKFSSLERLQEQLKKDLQSVKG